MIDLIFDFTKKKGMILVIVSSLVFLFCLIALVMMRDKEVYSQEPAASHYLPLGQLGHMYHLEPGLRKSFTGMPNDTGEQRNKYSDNPDYKRYRVRVDQHEYEE